MLWNSKENVWYPAVNTSTAWHEGWGWLLRARGIFGTTAVEGAAAIYTLINGYPWYVWGSLIVLLASTLLFLFALRQSRLKQIWVGQAFHHLSHNLREDVANVIQAAVGETDADRAIYKERYQQFHAETAERIAAFFRHLVGDSTIAACIRLARGQGENRKYVTVGRSKNLNPNRPKASEPIPADKGIARILRQRKKTGVCIYRDLPKAAQDDIWMLTENDKLPDIKTVMVVPINGYVEGQKSMVGILYVSSSWNPFLQLHIEPLMAFADLLGLVYPVITGQRR